jgi:hypothetical protein
MSGWQDSMVLVVVAAAAANLVRHLFRRVRKASTPSPDPPAGCEICGLCLPTQAENCPMGAPGRPREP